MTILMMIVVVLIIMVMKQYTPRSIYLQDVATLWKSFIVSVMPIPIIVSVNAVVT